MTTLASGFGAMPAMSTDRRRLRRRHGRHRRARQRRAGGDRPTRQSDDGADDEGTPVALLEANVDDVTGEVLAHTIARLLAAGAHDAWVTPIVMKKGRPAHTVSVLCDPASVASTAFGRPRRDRLARRADVDVAPLATAAHRGDRRRRGAHDSGQGRRAPSQGRVRRCGGRSRFARRPGPGRARSRSPTRPTKPRPLDDRGTP